MGQALTTLIVSQFHDQCLSRFDQTSFTTQICQTAMFTFFFLPYTKALVRYNLATFRACHDSDIGTDYFFFLLSFPPTIVPSSSHPFVLNPDYCLLTHVC